MITRTALARSRPVLVVAGGFLAAGFFAAGFLAAVLLRAGFFADADLTYRTLNKMVREAQLAQYNYILVVGAQEEKDDTVSVRTRDNAQHGVKSIDDIIAEFHRMSNEHVLDLQLGVGAEAAK